MTEQAQTLSEGGQRIFKGELHRVRDGQGYRFSNVEPAPLQRSKPRPLRVARMLALAHKMQEMIDRNEVESSAVLARRLGFTRARVSQLLDLTLLAPDIQEEILFAEKESGYDKVAEHTLRALLRERLWSKQRKMWREICPEKLSES
ncbi:MAG: hypothetical protein GY854_32170 [Deltaproteobacteria bacterium]|nr:hypothetical protein [Deltaproteobacteria bacterium]